MTLPSRLLPLLTCAAIGCKKPATTPKSTPPAPRWPACDPSATTQQLSLVHVNDLHSNYQLDKSGVSPYALVRGFYLSTKADNPFTLFTSGGDEYEKGSVAEQISQGRSTRDVLFGMQFDVRVIGNHDYGWSEDEVLQNARDPFAAVLSSNIHYKGSNPADFGAKDYVAMQVGCLKVGFFGLTSGPWNDQDQYVEQDFYPDFPTNLNYAEVAQQIVAQHRGEVDLLVGITHIGETTDEALAEIVPGIDVILGGHSHTPLSSVVTKNGTLITQAGSFAGFVSRLDLTVDLKTRKITDNTYVLKLVTPEDTDFVPDPATQKLVNDTIAKYAPNAQQPVAQLQADRTKGEIAQLAAQAAVNAYHVDAALVDLGTVWTSWTAGPLSDQSFLDAFKVEREPPGTPGFNSFYFVSIDGASLQKLKAELGTGWTLTAPDSIIPANPYRIALQKRVAFHPADYLPTGVTVTGAPQFASEAWQALANEAQLRTKACLYLDVDQPVPGCGK